MNNIPSWIPAAVALISDNARITANDAFTFSPPLLDAYGSVVLPYSSIRTSSVALSPSFPFTVRSITKSTPIVPPVIWPRILFAVSVICGMIFRII